MTVLESAVLLFVFIAGCVGQRGLVPAGPVDAGVAAVMPVAPVDAQPPPQGIDASAPAPAVDCGQAPADAGAPVDAGGAGVPVARLGLADGCDTQLDGRASAAVPGTWAADGPYRPCFTAGGQTLSDVTLSQDGTRIAALDLLGQAVVLDAATLQTRARFARRRGPYMAVALSPTGATLAARGQGDSELDLFRVDDGTLLHAVDLGPPMNALAVGLAFSPDGGRVAVTVGPDVAVVNVATGGVQGFADGTRCCADQLLFVDGGQKLVTARYAYDMLGWGSPAITLLDLATGELTTLFAVDDLSGAMGLAASSDSTTLLAFRGSELHAWDTATGSPKTVASGFPARSVMAVDASGSYVGVSNDYGPDGTHLQVRRLADGVLARDLLLQPGLNVAAWSLDQDRLVVTASVPGGSGGTRLGVIDTAGRTIARACSPAAGFPYVFATAAPRLLARAGNGLRVYDARSGDPVGPLVDPGTPTLWIGFSPDGDWIAWASSLVPSVGSQITLVNALTGEQRPIGEPAEEFFAVFPSSGGQFVAVMDTQTGLTRIIDAASQATVAQFDRSSKAVFPTGFSADGSALIFSDDAGNQQAVDWRTGTPQPLSSPTVQSLPGAAQAFMHDGNGCTTGLLPYASFSSDGRLAAVGSECGREFASSTLSYTDLYDVASGTLIQAVPNPSTDGPLLSADGAVLAFDAALWCRQ